jgi:hypothetical protein
MKIKDIEPVAYMTTEERFGSYHNRLMFQVNPDYPYKQGLYTAEQMQGYAKAKAYEAIIMADSDWTKEEIEDSFFDELFGEDE